jgi:hypothetical protein
VGYRIPIKLISNTVLATYLFSYVIILEKGDSVKISSCKNDIQNYLICRRNIPGTVQVVGVVQLVIVAWTLNPDVTIVLHVDYFCLTFTS